MDVLQYVKGEHERLWSLLTKNGSETERSILSSLDVEQEFRTYLSLQDSYLFPELTDRFARAEEILESCQNQHIAVRRAFQSVKRAKGNGIFKAFETLKIEVKQLFDIEEQQLMPKIRESVPTIEREDLGQILLDELESVGTVIRGNATGSQSTLRG